MRVLLTLIVGLLCGACGTEPPAPVRTRYYQGEMDANGQRKEESYKPQTSQIPSTTQNNPQQQPGNTTPGEKPLASNVPALPVTANLVDLTGTWASSCINYPDGSGSDLISLTFSGTQMTEDVKVFEHANCPSFFEAMQSQIVYSMVSTGMQTTATSTNESQYTVVNQSHTVRSRGLQSRINQTLMAKGLKPNIVLNTAHPGVPGVLGLNPGSSFKRTYSKVGAVLMLLGTSEDFPVGINVPFNRK